MEMNWFDIVTGALILIIGIKGIFNGLVKELAGLVGIAAGVWIASLFASPFGQWFGKHVVAIDSASALTMIGFLLLLALIWLGCILLGAIIAKLLTLSGLGILDRVLGFLFASAKVFVIISVIVFALSSIDIVRKNTTKFTDQSLMYPLFVKAGEWIVHLDLDDLAQKSESLKTGTGDVVDKGAKMIKTVKEKIKENGQ